MSNARKELEARARKSYFADRDDVSDEYLVKNHIAGYADGLQDKLVTDLVSAASEMKRELEMFCGCTYDEQCSTCNLTDKFDDAITAYEAALKEGI